MDDDDICPICCNELTMDDRRLVPCTCGFQICLWCLHKMTEVMKGKCPQCRQPYKEENYILRDIKDVKKKQNKRKQQQQQTAQALRKSHTSGAPNSSGGAAATGSGKTHYQQRHSQYGSNHNNHSHNQRHNQSRDHLKNVRVIQRNLVYVIGLAPKCAHEDVLRRHRFFGQYGNIVKIVVNRSYISGGERHHNSAGAYITFAKNRDARLCIMACDGYVLEGRTLKASFGTTKYCNAFVRGSACNNPDCLYLHDLGEPSDTFAKDQMAISQGRFQQQINPGRGGIGRSGPNVGTTKTGLPPPQSTKMGGGSGGGQQSKTSTPTTKRSSSVSAPLASASPGRPAWKNVAASPSGASSSLPTPPRPNEEIRRDLPRTAPRATRDDVGLASFPPLSATTTTATTAWPMPCSSGDADAAAANELPRRPIVSRPMQENRDLSTMWSTTNDPSAHSRPTGVSMHGEVSMSLGVIGSGKSSTSLAPIGAPRAMPSYAALPGLNSIWAPAFGGGGGGGGGGLHSARPFGTLPTIPRSNALAQSSNALKAFLGIGGDNAGAGARNVDVPTATNWGHGGEQRGDGRMRTTTEGRPNRVAPFNSFVSDSASHQRRDSTTSMGFNNWPSPSTSASLSQPLVPGTTAATYPPPPGDDWSASMRIQSDRRPPAPSGVPMPSMSLNNANVAVGGGFCDDRRDTAAQQRPSDVFRSPVIATTRTDLWTPLLRNTPPPILRGGPVSSTPESKRENATTVASSEEAEDEASIKARLSRLALWAFADDDDEIQDEVGRNASEKAPGDAKSASSLTAPTAAASPPTTTTTTTTPKRSNNRNSSASAAHGSPARRKASQHSAKTPSKSARRRRRARGGRNRNNNRRTPNGKS